MLYDKGLRAAPREGGKTVTDSLESIIADMRDMSARTSPMYNFADRLDKLVNRNQASVSTELWPEAIGEDSIVKLLADMEITPRTPTDLGHVRSRHFDTFVRRLRELIANDNVEPQGPEIVPAGDLRDLPPDTLVVRVGGDDGVTPNPYYMPTKARDVAHERGRDVKYRVLYRTPEKPIKIDDKLSSEREYRRAVAGTVVGSDAPNVLVKSPGGGWRSTSGERYDNHAMSVLGGGRGHTVRYVPQESK